GRRLPACQGVTVVAARGHEGSGARAGDRGAVEQPLRDDGAAAPTRAVAGRARGREDDAGRDGGSARCRGAVRGHTPSEFDFDAGAFGVLRLERDGGRFRPRRGTGDHAFGVRAPFDRQAGGEPFGAEFGHVGTGDSKRRDRVLFDARLVGRFGDRRDAFGFHRPFKADRRFFAFFVLGVQRDGRDFRVGGGAFDHRFGFGLEFERQAFRQPFGRQFMHVFAGDRQRRDRRAGSARLVRGLRDRGRRFGFDRPLEGRRDLGAFFVRRLEGHHR